MLGLTQKWAKMIACLDAGGRRQYLHEPCKEGLKHRAIASVVIDYNKSNRLTALSRTCSSVLRQVRPSGGMVRIPATFNIQHVDGISGR
jgi:hypothetical protein